MNRKEIDLLLSRIEGLKSFLENNSLENFQQEILNVENYRNDSVLWPNCYPILKMWKR